jgi:hypothetical protein
MTRRRIIGLAFLVAGSLALAAAQSVAADDSESGWGTVKGRIVWGGDTVPERKPITVTKDQEHCLSKGPLLSEDWIVNKDNKGIRWVYVWLAPETKGALLPIHPSLKEIKDKQVVLDQPCCQFEPHALALREGQELVAKNSAPIAHNINWTGGIKNPGNNVIVAPGNQLTISGLHADRFPIALACNIHPWMKGWVRVFDHPYFAVTDADGRFELKLAPAGSLRLFIWQESVGYRGGAKGSKGMPITVEAGKTLDLGNLDLEP